MLPTMQLSLRGSRGFRALELSPLRVLRVVLGGLAAFAFAQQACQPEEAAPPTVGSGHEPGVGGGGGGGGVEGGVFSTVDGGPAGTVLASAIFPQAIAFDSSNVYWTTASGLADPLSGVGDASTGTGAVEVVPKGGGVVSQVINGLLTPSSLTISGETLFLADASGAAGKLIVYPLATTAYTSVALEQFAPFPMAMNSNASMLVWATGTGTQLTTKTLPTGNPVASAVTQVGSDVSPYQPIAVTVLGTTLFVLASDGSDAEILSVPTGGSPSTLWKGSSVTASDLTSLGDTLYFALGNTVDNGGEVLELSASGGSVITLAYGQQNPAKVAVADTMLYFTSDVADGAVLAVGTGGGDVTTLATGLEYPFPIAVDDDAIYVGTATAVVAVAR